MKTSQVSYDCVVFLSKYIKGDPISMQLYEDDYYYEIAKGLQSVQVNLMIDGLGKATIRITPPLMGQRQTDDKILFRWNTKDKSLISLVNNPNKNDKGFSTNVMKMPLEDRKRGGILDTDKKQEYEPLLNSTHTECLFQPMDKVKIFMTNRFQQNKSKPKYSQVFDGLLSTCGVNYANGRIIITLQADDNLKWLAHSIYTINQAMDNSTLASIHNSEISHLQSNLQGMNVTDVIKKMVLGDESESTVEISEAQYNKFKELNYNPETLDLTYNLQTGVPTYKIKLPNTVGAGTFTLAPKGKGQSINDRTAVIRGLNFNSDQLFIDKEIGTFQAFAERLNNFSMFDHQYKTRLQTCKEIADIIEAEFYCDREGDIIFKAPDYNSNPGNAPPIKVLDELPIDDYTGAKLNADQYLIEDSEIINYNSTVSDKNIVTYLYLNGSVDFITDNVAKMNTSVAFSPSLVKRFGVRMFEKTVPVLGFDENNKARRYTAEGLLNRKNSEINQMPITIPLRPELRLARTVMLIGNLIQEVYKKIGFNPYRNDESKVCDIINSSFSGDIIYKSKNAIQMIKNVKIYGKVTRTHFPVYYISGITHNWTAGQQCITTIMGTHGRAIDTKFGKLEFLRIHDIPPKGQKLLDKHPT